MIVPWRLLPIFVVVVLLLGAREATAQPASGLSDTARALTRYLPSAAELPPGFQPATPASETSNEGLVGQPLNADLASAVVESRRLTGVTQLIGGRPTQRLQVDVSVFPDAGGAWRYARDYAFSYVYGAIDTILPGPDVGEQSVLYQYTAGSGQQAFSGNHLIFQRDRLAIEVVLETAGGSGSVDNALALARAIDARILRTPPAPPTESDLARFEEPAPAVLVRGAVRLLLDDFVEELDPADLFTEGWQGAARALTNAGVTSVPPSPAYPPDEDEAVALHMRSFPELERLAQGRLTPQELARAAINEIVAQRDDCHTVLRTPQEWQRDKAAATGGTQILIGFSSEKDGRDAPWRIIGITPNSPARAAGLRRGQTILALNGREVAGLTFGEARALIDTREGAPNVFRVQNPSGSVQEITVAPGPVVEPPLETEILRGNIGLIRFYGFDGGEAGTRQVQLMREALEQFESQGVVGWLIDLRANSGGNAATMNGMLSLFIDRGRLYGYMSRGESPDFFSAPGQALPFQRPLVMLVGPVSASASEILSGSLQARGRAVVVGETTSGCIGSFLVGTGLLDGSVLRVTNSEVVIGPDAQRLHRIGVTPNVEAAPPSPADDEAGRDPQVQAAADVLRQLTGTTPMPVPAARIGGPRTAVVTQ
jgi:C-terminal peptidase prc